MFTPLQKATPAFMKRYKAIKSGKETLDTAAKLKEFWLFAIAEGWKSREMREYIALLTEEVSSDGKLVWELQVRDPGWPSVRIGFEYFRDFKGMNSAPDGSGQTDEEYCDEWWGVIERWIVEIDLSQYK